MAVSVERGVPGTPTQVVDRSFFSGYSLLSRAGTYDVTADGQRFLMIKPASDGEPTAVVVVKNWIEELKRLVPVGR